MTEISLHFYVIKFGYKALIIIQVNFTQLMLLLPERNFLLGCFGSYIFIIISEKPNYNMSMKILKFQSSFQSATDILWLKKNMPTEI